MYLQICFSNNESYSDYIITHYEKPDLEILEIYLGLHKHYP